MSSEFGNRLAKLRRDRNMLQADLAEKLGVSKSSIGMWETSSREPDMEMVAKIADIFSVTIDYLLGRSDKIGSDSFSTPSDIKAWLRAGSVDLSEEERDILAEDLEEYFKMRKERILRERKFNK